MLQTRQYTPQDSGQVYTNYIHVCIRRFNVDTTMDDFTLYVQQVDCIR